jgi:hypothetical protein
MGTYKAMVLETGLSSTKNGFPQFTARVFLSAYFDQKASEWLDVSDNNWTISSYLSLFGKDKDTKETVQTLNFKQVCKVFDWDGCGPDYLASTDFSGKEIQVRIAENTGEGAKSPCQVSWIDVADADPSTTLKSASVEEVKKMAAEFAGLWNKKAPAVASAKKPAAKATPAPKPEPEPETPPAEEVPAEETAEERKAKILAKAKRLAKAEKPAEPTKKSLPAKGGKKPAEETSEATADIPEGYDKKAAWNDVAEMKAAECTDDQLTAVWHAAVAEIAPKGDEDNLDAAGWFAVKEQVLAEVGTF